MVFSASPFQDIHTQITVYHIIYRHNLLEYADLAGTHPMSCGHFFTGILKSFRPSENLLTWPLFSRSFKLVYTVDLDTQMSLKRLTTAFFGRVGIVDAKILTSRRMAALTVLNIFAYQSPENCSTQLIFTGHKRNDNSYAWSKFYQIAFKIEKVTDHKLLSNSIVITRYIEARCLSPSERLHYLGHYTAGEARNAIIGFLQLRSDDAYMEAKKRLTDRYGNAFITSNEFKKRLSKWPEVKVGDSKSLTDLADFLEQCQMVANSTHELKMFDSVSETDMIPRKLPRYLSDRWSRIVDRWIHEPEQGKEPQYPPFSQFVSFLSREARISSGPVTSRSREEDRRRPPAQREKNARVLFTAAPGNHGQDGKLPQQNHCAICKEDHPMDRCTAFIKMTLRERQDLVRQRGLCGGCLRRGHRWKECRRRQRCEKCERLHPTLLHDHNFSQKHSRTASTSTQTATSLHVTFSESGTPRCTHSMLVPVHLQDR